MNTDFKTINFDDLFNEDDVNGFAWFSSQEVSDTSNDFGNIVDLVEFETTQTDESTTNETKDDFYYKTPLGAQLSQHLSKALITKQQCEEITEIYKQTKYLYQDAKWMCQLQNLDVFLQHNGDPWLHSWIKFFKNLGGFQSLEEEDRFTLLSDNLTIFSILDGVSQSTVNGECWEIEDEKHQTAITPHTAHTGAYGCDVINAYYRLVSAFLPRWREDNTLMLLLILVGFFSPTQTMPYRNRSKIWKIQSAFYDLLRRYLKLKYPNDPFLFMAMIGLLARTRELSEKQKEIQTDGGLLSQVLCNMPSQDASELFRNLRRFRKSKPLQNF